MAVAPMGLVSGGFQPHPEPREQSADGSSGAAFGVGVRTDIPYRQARAVRLFGGSAVHLVHADV